MDVAITGASGFIGGALARSLAADGHQVVRVSRRSGGGRTVTWDPEAGTIDAAGLEGVDAVVHPAGGGVASGAAARAVARVGGGGVGRGRGRAGPPGRRGETPTRAPPLRADPLAGLAQKP